MKDTGIYKVVATNVHGQAVSSCHVIVNEDLTDQEVSQFHISECGSDMMTDQDDGSSNLFIKENISSYRTSSKASTRTVHVHEKSTKRTLGGGSGPATITKTKPFALNNDEMKPKFLKLFETCKVNENSVLLLTCQVAGSPMPEVKWRKDGHELKNNSRVNITYSSNGVSSLYISNALLDDGGVYEIVASNVHGVSVYYAEIYVERKKKR